MSEMDIEMANMLVTGNYIAERIPEAVANYWLVEVGTGIHKWYSLPLYAWRQAKKTATKEYEHRNVQY